MQNTILSLIDNVDQASAFAEYEVLSSLLDTYTKSMMISESVDITQEASLGIELNSPLTGRYDESKLKKILMFIPRLLASVIRAVVAAIIGAIHHFITFFASKNFNIGNVYSPVSTSVLTDLLTMMTYWMNDLNNSYYESFETAPRHNEYKGEEVRYVDYITDFITKKSSGHKFEYSDDRILWESEEISTAEETEDFVYILKKFDDKGKYHKILFTVSRIDAFNLNHLRDSIRDLKSSSRLIISSLNKASKYVNKGSVAENEKDKAAELREILPRFRSNIAYIMNFFTKITTKLNEAIQKQKDRFDNAGVIYDADEFDDDNSEEGNNEN